MESKRIVWPLVGTLVLTCVVLVVLGLTSDAPGPAKFERQGASGNTGSLVDYANVLARVSAAYDLVWTGEVAGAAATGRLDCDSASCTPVAQEESAADLAAQVLAHATRYRFSNDAGAVERLRVARERFLAAAERDGVVTPVALSELAESLVLVPDRVLALFVLERADGFNGAVLTTQAMDNPLTVSQFLSLATEVLRTPATIPTESKRWGDADQIGKKRKEFLANAAALLGKGNPQGCELLRAQTLLLRSSLAEGIVVPQLFDGSRKAVAALQPDLGLSTGGLSTFFSCARSLQPVSRLIPEAKLRLRDAVRIAVSRQAGASIGQCQTLGIFGVDGPPGCGARTSSKAQVARFFVLVFS